MGDTRALSSPPLPVCMEEWMLTAPIEDLIEYIDPTNFFSTADDLTVESTTLRSKTGGETATLHAVSPSASGEVNMAIGDCPPVEKITPAGAPTERSPDTVVVEINTDQCGNSSVSKKNNKERKKRKQRSKRLSKLERVLLQLQIPDTVKFSHPSPPHFVVVSPLNNIEEYNLPRKTKGDYSRCFPRKSNRLRKRNSVK